MCVPLLGQTEIWRRADIIVPLILSSYIIISELVAVPSRALQGIFEVESHDVAIAMSLSRSENKDGELLDTIPTMAKSTFTTRLGD